MTDLEALYSANTNNMKKSIIRELLKLTSQPGIISFAGGLPDPKTFPVEGLRLAADKVFRERAEEALQYGTTEGDAELKDRLIDFEARQGVKLDSDDLLVVSASQQAIDIACKVFLDPGDVVIAGRPTYLGEIPGHSVLPSRASRRPLRRERRRLRHERAPEALFERDGLGQEDQVYLRDTRFPESDRDMLERRETPRAARVFLRARTARGRGRALPRNTLPGREPALDIPAGPGGRAAPAT